MIDREVVHEILRYALYRDEEISDPHVPPEGAVIVQGVIGTFGLHPQRIAEKKDAIRALLAELPDQFKEGWSFLNLCMDRHGNLWTDLQRDMDELMVIGQAVGLVTCPMPREFWAALPGGVPYYRVTLDPEQGAIPAGISSSGQ